MDFVLNGRAQGAVADVLMANNFDTGVLRPFIGHDGRSYVTMNSGKFDKDGKPIFRNYITNAATSLHKDEWIQLDTSILKAARPRMTAVADLQAAGLVYNIPNGMAKTSLEYEASSDPGAATISMDGMREGESFRPHYDLRNLPLPIIHADFQFSARQVMTSRNGGSPIDTTMGELAGRRVAEEAEKLTLGVPTVTPTYGGGTVYGYANALYRNTKSLTQPTTGNQATTVQEVLAMRKQATDDGYFGPFVLYYSPAWYGFMDGDYTVTTAQPITLRQRLQNIDSITAVKPADYLTGTTLLLVQQTADVARLVVGMNITTVQWESHGGMQLNFKVMCILVPQVRWDFNHASGIVHGAV